jgi:hypothetical protein
MMDRSCRHLWRLIGVANGAGFPRAYAVVMRPGLILVLFADPVFALTPCAVVGHDFAPFSISSRASLAHRTASSPVRNVRA